MPRVRQAFIAVLLLGGAMTAATAQDKQKFETRFEKDKPFYQKLTTSVTQTVKVQGGSDVPLKHELTFYFKWTPVNVDKEKAVVKQSIEGVKFKLDIAGQTVDYDSTDPNPAGATGNPGLSEFFKNLIGTEFTVTFKGATIEKVDGREEMLKKLGAINPQIEQLLKTILTEDALKEMTDPAAGVSPPGEKAANETWEKKSTLSLGPLGAYDRTLTYTYKGKDPEKKELDRIEVKPSLQYKPPTAGGGGLPFTVKGGKFETKDVKQGVILYNPKAGRVESVRIEVTMSGELDVTVGTQDTKVSLSQDQRTELDSSDTSLLPKKQ